VILSTHILGEVQATCDRVLILNHGELAADAPIDEVRAAIAGGDLFRATFADGAVRLTESAIRADLEAIPGVRRVALQGVDVPGTYPYEVIATTDVRGALFDVAVGRGLRLIELSRERSSLEEVFRRLTLGADETAAG
jgi:ABC-2 type transport system ATP-binding protein